ncbi:MAG: adenosylcobinamide-phosphate synthase CbiB [Ruminococcus sp.]|nr:adenosylcobinamide-phosphate synthase CbiB [Ruminococcus sp.]
MKALPIIIGFILDFILGDPYSLPHPVRLMGRLISELEGILRDRISNAERAGTALAVSVAIISTVIPLALLTLCYRINLILGLTAEGILCYYLIAARCLKKESMKVFHALWKGDIKGARKALSMIVGRECANLEKEDIIRAAVETVAENASDGVAAPIFYMMIGGAPLGYFYKAVNTMDSMIGYKNEKYREFGRFAAILDDVVNFIPSRLTALLMILAAYALGYNGKEAARVWKRDRRNHASPNSAQTESVCAGALGIRLGGDAYYFGKLCRKPFIGDATRPPEREDIYRANSLMYLSSVFMLIIACGFRMTAGVILW